MPTTAPPPGMLAAYVKSRFEDTPLVITHHGGEQYESHGGLRPPGRTVSLHQSLDTRACSDTPHKTIPSAGYIKESQVLTNPDVDVTRLRNGVPVDKSDMDLTQAEAKTELGLDPDEFVILYMGALHQRKGPDVPTVKAFEQIDDDIGDTTLIMAGSGGLAESLRADAGRLWWTTPSASPVSYRKRRSRRNLGCCGRVRATVDDGRGGDVPARNPRGGGGRHARRHERLP